MKPSSIYALPTIRSEPWYFAGSAEDFFGDWVAVYDDRPIAAKADAVTFDDKLYYNVDGERSVSYAAVMFNGNPIGVMVNAGRGGRDHRARYVTDPVAFNEASAYIRQFLTPELGESEQYGVDQDIEALDHVYGYVVAQVNGQTRLADADDFTHDGRLAFDREVFRSAFDEIVRPAFNRTADYEEGIGGQRMKDLTAQALLKAVPDGMETSVEFSGFPKRKSDGEVVLIDWPAVLVGTDEGTYAIGLPEWGMAKWFAWVSHLRCERVGGPELFGELTGTAAPSP